MLKRFYEFGSIVTGLEPCRLLYMGLPYPMPKRLEDLMAYIKRESNKIPESVIKYIYEILKKRCNLVVTSEDGHIE